ncbi:MAG: NAD(P)-binding protein [Deltaproteobacteria bacterium]|jgi:NADPH-dependent glutamate synthase beta subunit-like oxidoreductase|nr:NAD(P)-binding protein [Deltaproteobacteria bacterium]
MDLKQFQDMEARCTQEDMPRCTAACPIHVDVRAMLSALRKNDFSKAYAVFAQAAPFPGIISRLCDHPCQKFCIRADMDESVAVNALEQACIRLGPKPPVRKGLILRKNNSVAVVGAGISGLTAAFYLARKGYKLSIFDSGNAFGGRLSAFSEETLPRQTLSGDFDVLADLHARARFGVTLGLVGDISLAGLLEKFDAVYLGLGRREVSALALGLELNADKTIRIDPETLGTSKPGVFAGGTHRQPENDLSLISSVADGKAAMISIDRYIQGASLTAARSNIGPQPTRLFTDTGKVAPRPALAAADPAQGYTGAEAVAEAERCLDCECMECVRRCEYLKHYKIAPRMLGRQIFKNRTEVVRRFNRHMNSCSLCRQCEAVCRDDFSMAEICHAAREDIVRQGKMPPSAFGFALQDMKYSDSDVFTLARHEFGRFESRFAFYPGCQLSGSAPWQVAKTYAYLREKISGGVGLMLGCCGVQADWAGEREIFANALQSLRAQWEGLGRPGLILGCPTCYMVFKKNLPEIPVDFLFSLVEKLGLPEVPPGESRTLAVHDSCTTRYEKEIQNSVRSLLGKLGHVVEELENSKEFTGCCGFGGLMQISNAHLAHQVADRRIGESESDYAVYCAMCRDNFANRGKTAYHLLDLIFGDEAGNIAARPPVGYSRRHDNRARLKAALLRDVWGEDAREEPSPIRLLISPEIRALMEDYLIMDADLRSVIAYAERTGNKLQNGANGHFFACCKPAHVTYWAEYSVEGNGYAIHDAYCHRLEIIDAGSACS